MKPRIGIVGNVFTGDSEIFYHNHATYTFQGNIDAITQAGGLPVVIPIQSEELAGEYFENIDGLFLPGGQDVTPQFIRSRTGSATKNNLFETGQV
ncbi:gamma-glutamyl-gamma-aminobutyrate hydrolase family protein [Pediococcus parvulus]|uniref:gamma-glutamyl-gamma-aminobutyrate hydrolase family protein n=1 Tax=Pediococcus parvulus TaxID=54062 RepID=UPI00345EFC44